ncbi:hypothetical protein [Streptococcus sp. 19428wA2_WM07]|nr:hypothetical protein [Streptococcus sp. 19428wA2_WM07]MBF0806400.1 hypothetical protein [Streptococcus sp. 19428wA2_WM07]
MVDSRSFTRINLCDLGQVHLITGKTDMRQGIDSLAYLYLTKNKNSCIL